VSDILGGERWKVLQGDCLDLLRSLPDGSVDAVVTDPPYGIAGAWKGGSGHGWGLSRTESPKRNEWDASVPVPEIWEQISRVSKKSVIWGGNYFPLSPSRCWLLWIKPERGFTLAEAEMAWTNLDAVVRCYDAPRHIRERQHPTQKPLEVMLWSIEKCKLRTDSLILDPFCGSGTTGVAAMRLGMRFLGCELDPAYCNIARARIAAAAAQPRLDFEGQEQTPKPKAVTIGMNFQEGTTSP
jgi:site-specific DNA-methyltransferase (adenine-specific)